MGNRGTLVPEHYVSNPPTADEIELSSIIWGLSLGISVYTAFSSAKQTLRTWRRVKKVTFYMILMWFCWTASTIMGVVSWAFMKGFIQPSLEYFLTILICWFFQVQTLFQIIINRISVLSVPSVTVFRLKWGIFALTLLINISVACIWVPSALQINETFIKINVIWDRLEKVFIALIDIGLNLYFIYLVRSRLIANGLTKYNRLFNFNLGMIFVSVSLDILIVAMMSLPNKFVYLQFHPVAYLLKLQIELGMADLIVKIVKATNPQSGSSGPYIRTGPTIGTTTANARSQHAASRVIDSWSVPRHQQQQQQHTRIESGGEEHAVEMELFNKGIKKTVVTEITTSDVRDIPDEQRTVDSRTMEEGRASRSSSTAHLKQGIAP